MNIKENLIKFKSFLLECARVLKVTRKPTSQEYKTVVKASALGMALIGLIGFSIVMAKQLLIRPF